ncbi:hypothetical protein F66182_8681 [Fusarium sp. NRRL 66182]|nr:hypothetical protein F66182_8681 [Fusarium sp. NRRL 66182]
MSSTESQSRIAMRYKHYNEHCEIQYATVQAGLDLIPSYVDKTNLVVVDYGCAQGANSIEPLEKAISTLADGATASLIFEDTPFNDFGSLARTVAQHFADPDRSVLVAPSLVPLGFYQQVIPDGHADLGFSWSSFNYLEHMPSVSLDATASPAEFGAARHKALSAAGHTDLIKILKLRAREIRHGGYLIAALGGQKPEGEKRASNPGAGPIQAGLMRLAGEGKLSYPELMRIALFPSHERTPGEVRAALEDPGVAPLWQVESLEPKLIEHPAWAIYQAAAQGDEGKRGEALREYARAVITNMTSASGWFWVDVLKHSRGEEWDGGDDFLQNFIEAAVEEFVAKFADLKVEIWYTYIKLKRTEELEDVLDGIDVLFLISYPSHVHQYRARVHVKALDAARKAGVEHIFYSSLGFARDNAHNSKAEVMQAHLIASYAKSPWSFQYTNQIVTLTGPKSWTLAETAEVLSRTAGAEMQIEQVSVEAYAKQPQVKARSGSEEMAATWATAWNAIRAGETDAVNSTSSDILGREPEPFEKTVEELAKRWRSEGVVGV